MKAAIYFLLPFLFCQASFAQDLESRLTKARADNAVTEQASGYLKALSDDPSVKALVEEVNKKRREKYKEVTSKTEGAKLETVEQAAGKLLMEKYNR
jgi:uncharacterized protein